MSLSRHSDPSHTHAVALIDARYLRWLARLDDAGGVSLAALSRSSLNEPLHHALQRTGARAADPARRRIGAGLATLG